MDTRYLEILVALDTYKTLSNAAFQLGISQPALSRSMQKLEEEMKVPLFHRTKNSLSLNENGKYLLHEAKHLLKLEKLMKEKLIVFDATHRTIHIGISAPGPKAKYEKAIQELYPQSTILWTMQQDEMQLLQDLQDGKYTCIFIQTQPTQPIFTQKQCFVEHLQISVLPAHPASHYSSGITFQQIDGQTFLMNNQIGVWHSIVQKHLPHSRFLLQDNPSDLDTLIDGSTFPTFHTNLTDPSRFHHSNRIMIPIIDADASMSFSCVILKKNQSQFGTLFHIFK